MADVRDELLLIVVRLRDLIRHEVQGLRKVAHLILRVRRDLVVIVAGGILRGPLRDALQRAVDDDIEDGHDQQRQDEDDERCEVDDVQDVVL